MSTATGARDTFAVALGIPILQAGLARCHTFQRLLRNRCDIGTSLAAQRTWGICFTAHRKSASCLTRDPTAYSSCAKKATKPSCLSPAEPVSWIRGSTNVALQNQPTQSMTTYWGVQRPADLCQYSLAMTWEREQGHIRYVPMLSGSLRNDHRATQTSLVSHATMTDFSGVHSHQPCAWDAPTRIDATKSDFVEGLRLPLNEFCAETFRFGGYKDSST